MKPRLWIHQRLILEHPSCIATDVSVLINNAGISRATSVLDPDTSRLRDELETNLFGPLAMASTFADRIAGRSGVIVNVVSILAWMPVGASYGVSKAAMWSATDSMRTELAPRGVQVVGVYVGLVDKVPMGAFVNKGLTMKTGQTHIHRYLAPLMKKIQEGEIDPSFVITHSVPLEDGPAMYKTFRDKLDGCIEVVLKP